MMKKAAIKQAFFKVPFRAIALDSKMISDPYYVLGVER